MERGEVVLTLEVEVEIPTPMCPTSHCPPSRLRPNPCAAEAAEAES